MLIRRLSTPADIVVLEVSHFLSNSKIIGNVTKIVSANFAEKFFVKKSRIYVNDWMWAEVELQIQMQKVRKKFRDNQYLWNLPLFRFLHTFLENLEYFTNTWLTI